VVHSSKVPILHHFRPWPRPLLGAVCHQKANKLIWPTCLQNLKALVLATPGIWTKTHYVKIGWFGVTGVTQGHRQCHQSTQWIWFAIHLLQKLCICLISVWRYNELFVKNSKIFLPHIYLALLLGWPIGISLVLDISKLYSLCYSAALSAWSYV